MEETNYKVLKSGGGRIAYLDAIKCFAILLVIEGHVRTIGMHIRTGDILSGLMFYSFDLPLFFFVSGYLAYKQSMDISVAWANIRKKFVCLIVPAVVVSTAYHLLNHESLLSPLFKGFGKYWFTIVLFECFLIYYFLLVFIRRESIRNSLLVFVSVMGIILLSKYSVFGPKILDFNHLCKYFYFFAIGLFAKEYNGMYTRMMNSEILKGIAIVAFFVILFSLDYNIYSRPVTYFTRDIVLRVLGTTIVVVLFYSNAHIFENGGKINKVIKEIGRKSLPIYLLQYFFVPDFSAFSDLIAGLDSFTIHVATFFYTIFIVAACYCTIYVLEQSRFVRMYVLGQKTK